MADAFGNLTRVYEYLNEPQTYEAETLAHQFGSASGVGWLSPVAGQPAGILTYGPYQTPAAARPRQVARFRLAIDGVNGNTDAVAQIDVYCNATQTALASRTLYRHEFYGGLDNFSEFVLTFDTTGYASHLLEYRVYWYSTARLLHDRTWVVGTHNKTTTLYGYDTPGRKTEMKDPDMGQWYYYYDNAGNLIAQVDARQQASNFYYDTLNWLRGKTYATTTTPATYARPADPGYIGYTVKDYYDEATYGYSMGYRTRTVDTNTNTAWTYDARGRVTQERKTISGNQFYTTYTYDAWIAASP